jgi:hypothetical protein
VSVKDFEENIKHLSQQQILTAGIDTLNKLLVEKGICTNEELQNGILDWMEKSNLKSPESEDKETGEDT